MIYACYAGMPDDNELRRGANRNDDGAGICWVEFGKTKDGKNNNRVRWIKGLKSDPDEVKKVITDNKITYPFAIHFRSASIGGASAELTHPFPIAPDAPLWIAGHAPLVLMHNGHIGDWKNFFLPAVLASQERCPDGPWSDSRALSHLVHLKGEGILDFIIGSSRVLVMDRIPSQGCDAKDPQSYMRMYGSWINDEKEGYSQSTQTFEVTIVRGKGRESGSSTSTATPSSTGSSGISMVRTEDINVWTLDELETLANDIEKEQADARKQLGGN